MQQGSAGWCHWQQQQWAAAAAAAANKPHQAPATAAPAWRMYGKPLCVANEQQCGSQAWQPTYLFRMHLTATLQCAVAAPVLATGHIATADKQRAARVVGFWLLVIDCCRIQVVG
jgi:hypothetical protein